MNATWRDVFVDGYLVASSDFTARRGQPVSVALELYCQHRVTVPHTTQRAVVEQQPGVFPYAVGQAVYTLTGVVAAAPRSLFQSCWYLDLDGLLIHVSEAPADDREPGSDPDGPPPTSGTWARARGHLAVLDDYVTADVEEALRPQVERLWTVERIVHLTTVRTRHHSGAGRDVHSIAYQPGASPLGYLIDLAPRAPIDGSEPLTRRI